jgi:undecaprenyl-diphosphatase
VTAFDRHWERWIVHHRAQPFDAVFVWLTRVGTWGAVWLVIALGLALVWRRASVFIAVALADLAAEGLAGALKAATAVGRPPRRFVHPDALVAVPHSSSFPSGHASTSFACATVLSFFVPRGAPAFYLLALAIGFSRIYVGVHWPLDVLGGAILGIAVGLAVTALLRRGAGRRVSARPPR